MRFLTRDSVTIFLVIFICWKDSSRDPYDQAKTVSRTFLFSWRYSIAKAENRLSAQSLTTRKRNFCFRYKGFLTFKWLILDCLLCKHTHVKYLFCLIVPLKSVRSLQFFQKCPCSPCLRWPSYLGNFRISVGAVDSPTLELLESL